MKHKYNFYWDTVYPILRRIIGKRYGCCGELKNCTRCIKKKGWTE